MLHFILGPAGSGKTAIARRLLAQKREEGQDVMLLVPEQYSYETERAVLEQYGEAFFAGIQITSFARLPDAVFRRYGSKNGSRLDDTGRHILMSMALDDTQDYQQMLGGHAAGGELIRRLLLVEKEMKTCSLQPHDLSQAGKSCASSALREKAEETALILSAFEAYVQQSYLDPQDDLMRLCESLTEHPECFSGITLILDSFHGFTEQEYQVLQILMRRCKDLYITLCTDRMGLLPGDDSLFAPVCHTLAVLKNMASQNGIPIAVPQYLTDKPRYQNSELAFLADRFFRTGPQEYEGIPEHIHLLRAAGRYEECMAVGALIRRCVQEKGYRYRDITVIVRDENEYQNALQAAFDQYEIPVFLDRPASVESEPLIRLILAAFDCVQYGFRTDDVMAVLKCGLIPMSLEEIAGMENYVFLWNLRSGDWKTEWTKNPAGFVQDFSEKQKQELAHLEGLRRQLIEPLIHFAEKGKDPTGKEIAAAVYSLLQEYQIETTLPQLAEQLRLSGRLEDARLQERLWEMLMQILDQTAMTLAERKIPLLRYHYLLRQIFRVQRLSSIPQHMDEVTVSVAGRMRAGQPKVVFLLGAVLGKFPRIVGESDGMFSENERKELIRCGLNLHDTLEERIDQERFSAYTSVCSASEEVVVSYPLWDGKEENTPSEIITQILALFPRCPMENARDLPLCVTASSAETLLAQFALRHRDHSAVAASVRTAAQRLPDIQPSVQAVYAASNGVEGKIRDSRTARKLFMEQKISATQIETYYKCPFRYFCRYGLRIKEPLRAELNALQYGNLAHYVLEHMLPQLAENPSIQGDSLQEKVDQWMDRYAQETLGGLSSQTARFQAMFRHYREVIGAVVRYAADEMRATDFTPAYFEQELGQAPVDTLKITLPDGESVEVGGKIDRIDLCRIGEKTYVRIIDYKTGKKDFELSHMLSGMDLQMMLYLCAVLENHLFSPAGILYMPVRTDGNGKIADRMSGMVVENDSVLTKMDHTYRDEGKGAFIPVGKTKAGAFARGSRVISESGMKTALSYTRSRVEIMAKELCKGNIQARPLLVQEHGCSYCPYYAVCGKEYQRFPVEKNKQSPEETLRQMQEEMKEGMLDGNSMDPGPEAGY